MNTEVAFWFVMSFLQLLVVGLLGWALRALLALLDRVLKLEGYIANVVERELGRLEDHEGRLRDLENGCLRRHREEAGL